MAVSGKTGSEENTFPVYRFDIVKPLMNISSRHRKCVLVLKPFKTSFFRDVYTNAECLIQCVCVLLYPRDTQDFLTVSSPRRETVQGASISESLVRQLVLIFIGRGEREQKHLGFVTV